MHYAQNYAGIIGSSLLICINNRDDITDNQQDYSHAGGDNSLIITHGTNANGIH